MNLSVAVKFDGLLRNLRLAGHGLAEAAEQGVLRAVRSVPAAGRPQAVRPEDREKEGDGR